MQTLIDRAYKDAINRFTVTEHVSFVMEIYNQSFNI